VNNILAVDTSGSFCSVALSSHGKLYSLTSAGSGDHFEQLSNTIREVCGAASLDPSQIAEMRVGLGPGSFTGLRIGMSFIKGLAWSVRAPLIGLSSFSAIAAVSFTRSNAPKRVVVIADARRDEVFAGSFLPGAHVHIEPCIVPLSALDSEPWSVREEGVVVVSPQRDFEVPDLPMKSEGEAARGLLLLPVEADPSFAVGELAMIEPSYIRAVAAKTIAERKIGA
jgi:tRNA threonylcarbamoyladenosine biosynthesis protein TsaB